MNHIKLKTKINLILFLCLFIGFLQNGQSQIQAEWDQSLGGNIWEELNSIEQTADGGYIMAGFTSSSENSDVGGITNGGGDYWIVKTNSLGQIEWEDNFGGNQLERPWKVLPTSDGGYMVAGYSPSDISGDKSEASRGGDDYWILKLDNQGVLQWDRTYGGDGLDFCYDMIETNDGGFLLGGRSLSGISGEKTEANLGSWDYWLVKIDANGLFQWDKTIGGNDEDLLGEMQLAPDGDVLIAGGTRSVIGADITEPLIGVKDFWLIKVDDANGDLIWQRRYGGTDEDEIFSFVQTSDGGYLLGGGSRSDANPPFKDDNSFGVVDMYVVKTDAAGTVEWNKTFGGAGLDNCYSVRQNSIDYYILSGFSNSDISGNKTTPTNGGHDFWIIYLDNNGNKLWESSLGGAENDVLENAFQIDDGGYMLAGHSSSDVSGDKQDPSNGFNDFWIIKTICDVEVDLPDTIVCPNVPVELDAFNGTNCVGCTWVWGDITTGDSIRLVETDVTTTYSITLTDGVGCSRSDEVTINVIPTNITVDLDDAIALCDGDDTTLDAGNPGNDFDWSNGATTQTITVMGAGLYTVSVTDNNSCTFTDSTLVTVGNSIAVDLGPDTSLCMTETLTLDAGNLGLNYLWSPNLETEQTITASPPGVYSVVVSDLAGCTGSDEINITAADSPFVMSTTTVCNDTNTYYVLTLEIGGGDPNTYMITGVNGVLDNNIFTSVQIPKDAPYALQLSDAAGCAPLAVNGVYDCDCTSSVGDLNAVPVVVCGNELATFTLDTPSVLDFNDVLRYVLHNGDPSDPASVLATAGVPEFAFQTGMDFGTTYFVSALLGNVNDQGEVMLQDGCLSISNAVEVSFHENPIAAIEALTTLSLSCVNQLLILEGTSSQIPGGGQAFYNWSATNGGNIVGSNNDPNVEVDAAGTYLLTLSNAAGCTAKDSVEVVHNGTAPEVIIATPGLLSCVDTIVQIDASASSTGPNLEAVWTGGMLTGVTSLTPEVSQVGLYTLTITDTISGCFASESVGVLTSVTTFNVNTSPITYLTCASGDSATLYAFSFPASDTYEYEWIAVDSTGSVIIGNDSIALVEGPGTYQVNVTDTENGCTASTAGAVLLNQIRPKSAWLKATFPICLGDLNGSLRVDSILGGTEPYLYSFNESPFSADTITDVLGVGEHLFTVEDALGCQWDTIVTLPDGKLVQVDIEEPYGFVELGDSIRIIAITTEPVDSISWTSPFLPSCDDCLGPWIHPIDSFTIGIDVVNWQGCSASDEITVLMEKNRNVFIPNAFSPNGNRRNEWFNVYTGKAVKSINYLKIFTRVGGIVFEAFDLPLGDPKHGWNGEFENGKTALPGVYIYMVEVEYLDGVVERFNGDLTLFR